MCVCVRACVCTRARARARACDGASNVPAHHGREPIRVVISESSYPSRRIRVVISDSSYLSRPFRAILSESYYPTCPIRVITSESKPYPSELMQPICENPSRLSESLIRVIYPSRWSLSLVVVACPNRFSESLFRVACPSSAVDRCGGAASDSKNRIRVAHSSRFSSYQ